MTDRFDLLTDPELAAALASARPPLVVDVRDQEEYEKGRIPGSRLAPVHDLGRLRARLPASLAARVIVIGDDRERARAAANFLALLGFGDVGVLEGGIAAWTGALERGPAPDPAGESGGGAGARLRIIEND